MLPETQSNGKDPEAIDLFIKLLSEELTWSAVSFSIRGVIQSGPQDFVTSREHSSLKTISGVMVTELNMAAEEISGLRLDVFSFVNTEQKY